MPRTARVAFPSLVYHIREYVCSNRDREDQEIREKMTRGVIGAEMYHEMIEKRVIENRGYCFLCFRIWTWDGHQMRISVSNSTISISPEIRDHVIDRLL